jgi:hypothetical protein
VGVDDAEARIRCSDMNPPAPAIATGKQVLIEVASLALADQIEAEWVPGDRMTTAERSRGHAIQVTKGSCGGTDPLMPTSATAPHWARFGNAPHGDGRGVRRFRAV